MNLRYHTIVVVINVAVLAFIIAATVHSFRKAGLSEADALLFPLRIESVAIDHADDAEMFLSRYAIGDSLRLEYTDARGESVSRTSVTVPYDDTSFIVFKLLLAAAIFALGIFVYFFRSPGIESALFNLTSVALVTAIMGTKTIYSMQPPWVGTLLCGMFFVSYGALAVFFLQFTLYFPHVKSYLLLRLMPVVYAVTGAVAVWNCVAYLRDARSHEYARFDESIRAGSLLNGVVVLIVAIAVGNFIHSYATALDGAEKKKLKWVLFGLCVGPTPFILFSALPQAFGKATMVPETLMLSFLLVVPLTFTIAIVRHRILNIDLLINRSIVYGIVLGALLVVATLLVGVFANVANSYARVSSPMMLTVAAALFALLLQPLKKRVQEYVDKRLFHVRYNYRQTQQRLFEEIRHSYDVAGLAGLVIREVQKIVPVERIAFFTLDQATRRLKVVAHENFALLELRGIPLRVEELKSALRRPVALDAEVEPGLDIESADTEVFGRWGMALVLTCASEDGAFLGFLVLGRKKSGFRFVSEDVDLLAGIAAQAGLALQRISLQERLMLEHAEAERLDKLNKMKSYFVSSVTHDLKTPLTSIKMFAELLRTNDGVSKGDRNEFLEIIEGESDRLTRMINNVLDFSMVERGIKKYYPVPLELNREVEAVLRSVGYQLKLEKFTLECRLSPASATIRADKDAFAESLLNLISNAMKYSLQNKRIAVSTFTDGNCAGVRVEDKGAGIPHDKLQLIFEQFYRVDDGRSHDVSGTGLGLAIVKHIMDAHGGKVDVVSAVGEGSTFTLLFPLEESHETHSGH